MGVALFSEVLGTQLDQGRMVHSRARCPRAARHAETGASPRASASLLFFLLKHVAQGALAGSHRVLQRGTQETVGRPRAVTWDELDGEEKVKKTNKKRGTRFRRWRER